MNHLELIFVSLSERNLITSSKQRTLIQPTLSAREKFLSPIYDTFRRPMTRITTKTTTLQKKTTKKEQKEEKNEKRTERKKNLREYFLFSY